MHILKTHNTYYWPRVKCFPQLLTLFLDHCHVSDLPVGVEGAPDVVVSGGVIQAPDIERGDHPVLRGVQVRHGLGPLEDLVRHRVIDAIVSVLHVLLTQRVVRVGGLLVSVGALLPPLTLALHPERADVGSVPLVIRRGPGELGQQLGFVAWELPESSSGPHRL